MSRHKIKRCGENWGQKISCRLLSEIYVFVEQAHTHTHKHARRAGTARTQGLNASEKRMAQQTPGHNASLHPLISSERIEGRRKKGGNREVERAKRKKGESGESDRENAHRESRERRQQTR